MRTATRTLARSWIVALAASIVLSSAAAAQPEGGPPPGRVVVDEARLDTVTNQRRVTGEIVSTRRAVLASEVEGLITQIDLDEGDLIEAGRLVASLDDEIARIDVRRAEASLRSARAIADQRRGEAQLAERDLGRIESAGELGSANESQIDAARTRVMTAEAQLDEAEAMVLAAEADLARAKRVLDDKTILAPFTGRVLRKEAELGEWLNPGDGIVELISMDRLEARVEVPESLLPFLDRSEGAVTLNIPGLGPDRTIPGTVIGELPAADSVSRLFTVRVGVTPGEARLRPRMSLTAMVPTSERTERLTIHNDAIRRDDAGAFVYLARPVPNAPEGAPAHTARAVRIDPLFIVDERMVVRSGVIREGDLVVTVGNERTFPGQPLIIVGREGDRGGNGDDNQNDDQNGNQNGERAGAGPDTDGTPDAG